MRPGKRERAALKALEAAELQALRRPKPELKARYRSVWDSFELVRGRPSNPWHWNWRTNKRVRAEARKSMSR
ncbi:MAG: hypothetical protein ACW99J_20925 [Candidatus Thorarchaeota archaeon]|jgi:hypothetical protein